jgi:hypothetical protein
MWISTIYLPLSARGSAGSWSHDRVAYKAHKIVVRPLLAKLRLRILMSYFQTRAAKEQVEAGHELKRAMPINAWSHIPGV